MKAELFIKFILLFGLAANQVLGADTISLKQYIDMAHAKDPSAQSADMAFEGSKLIQNSASLITGVNLIANGSYLSDGRPTVNAAFMGDKTLNNSYAFGLQQQTSFGLMWTVSQNYSYTKINNASFLSVPEYYDAYPKLELSIPLWRNLLGAETKANIGQAEDQLKVQRLNSELVRIQKESEIKDAYFSLCTQQKYYEIQKDSLQRAERILTWAQSRVTRNLSDKSDLYQTQALVSSRQLELSAALVKLKETSRAFNSFLEIDSDTVTYKLADDEIKTSELELSKQQAKARLDLVLQKEIIKATESSYLAQKEKNKPSLNLSMQYLKQGRDTAASAAQDKIFSENKDYQLVALTFNIPLDLSNLSNSKEGYALLANSQILAEKARSKNESIQWKNAVDQAELLASQLKIVRELESIQKSKADLERSKYNNGRSTTYQVLMFEQDYVNSRNQRLNVELQTRKFITSLEMYR